MSNPEAADILLQMAIDEGQAPGGERREAALMHAIAILRRLEGMLPERREKVAGGALPGVVHEMDG